MSNYNFFEVYEKKSSDIFNVKSPLFIGAVVLVLCILLSLGLLGRNFLMVNHIENVRAEITTIQGSAEYAEAVQLKNSIDAIKEYDLVATGVMTQFKMNNVIDTELLQKLASQLPSTVTLTNFTMDNAVADFTFNVANQKTVSELVLRMKDSGLFLDVSFNAVTANENGAFQVVINTVMKAGEAE